MCTYVYVHYVIGFFSFFVPAGPLGLIIVRHFQKKRSNAAMLQSGKNTANDTRRERRQDLKSQPVWSFQFFKDPGCWSVKGLNQFQGSYKKLPSFFKDFSSTTLDFHGPPSRNIISQIVQKCTFPVYSNKTVKAWTVCFTNFSTFFQFTCLQLIVDYCTRQRVLYVNNL